MVINDEYVDDELIRHESAGVAAQLRAQFPEMDELEIGMRARELGREQVIGRVLLMQAARQDPTPISEEAIAAALEQGQAGSSGSGGMLAGGMSNMAAMRGEAESRLRMERLVTGITATVERPGTREIAEFYDQHKETFFLPERVHAGHIIKNIDETIDEAEAYSAISKVEGLLRAGNRFEELADQYSDCPGRGGDLGFFGRGEMVEEFDAVVFGLTVGTVSGIFRTCFGFHIAKLYGHRPAGACSLNEVRAEIERELWARRRVEAARVYVSGLRSRAEIKKA